MCVLISDFDKKIKDFTEKVLNAHAVQLVKPTI